MWWLVGLGTFATMMVAANVMPSRWPEALSAMVATAVSAVAFVGLVELLIPVPPDPVIPAAQVVNQECSDAIDKRLPEATSLLRYGGCHGYNACNQKARLDGMKPDCADWRKWPDATEADAITKRYVTVYHDELAKEAREQGRMYEQYGDLWSDYPETDEPPCTSFIYC